VAGLRLGCGLAAWTPAMVSDLLTPAWGAKKGSVHQLVPMQQLFDKGLAAICSDRLL
jgi:hypothetical protein